MKGGDIVAKIATKVNEQKLRQLADNWHKKDITELAKLLGVGESTVNYWAGKIRKSLKAKGISEEEIKKLLPSKRKQTSYLAYETITSELIKKLQEPEKKK